VFVRLNYCKYLILCLMSGWWNIVLSIVHVIVTRLIVYVKKKGIFQHLGQYTGNSVWSHGIFTSYVTFPCEYIAFLCTTALLVVQTCFSLLKYFELNALEAWRKRRNHNWEYNTKMDHERFQGIHWTELVDGCLQFDWGEYSYIY
jgi:hypothetical protein